VTRGRRGATVGGVNVPDDLRYSNDHEWVRVVDDGCWRVGITDYAQDSLGDVVFVEPPAQGSAVNAGDSCGEIESTKSVSEVYTPVAGTVTAVNSALEHDPSLLNSDPYGEGWIYEMQPDAAASLESLLTADAYRALIGE